MRSTGRGAAALLALLTLSSTSSAQLPDRLPRRPLLEIARQQVRADVAVATHGVRGAGGVLCLVDTGVDRLRIEAPIPYLFVPGGSPDGDAFGERFGGAVFRNRSELPPDTHGHGTAMASIALGVAPDATLIVVAAYDAALGGFADDAVVAGVRFCRAVAAEDDTLDLARMVVLLSLGGHDGAHDGAGAFEAALAAEAETPIVVAAGNDGARAVHAQGRALAQEDAEVELRLPEPTGVDPEVALAVRVAAASPAAGFFVTTDDGEASPLWRAPEASTARVGAVAIDLEPRGDSTTVLHLRGAELGAAARLTVRGPASFDVWLAEARLGATFLPASLGGAHVSRDAQVTIPATAPALIAVGASLARAHPAAGGGPSLEAGERAELSSLGPTAAGAPKPDLMAPGQWLIATRSSQLAPGDATNVLGGRPPDPSLPEDRLLVRGTSASAALVAGALLLALEIDPGLGPRARQALIATASDEAWTPGRGWGELDVAALLDRAAGHGAPPTLSVVGTRPFVPGDPALWLTARGPGGTLEIEGEGARQSLSLARGAAQVALPPPLAEVGSLLRYQVQLEGHGSREIQIPVRLSRGPRGDVRPGGGGGCAVAPSSAGEGTWWGLVLLGLVSRRARRGRRPRFETSAPDRRSHRHRPIARPCS